MLVLLVALGATATLVLLGAVQGATEFLPVSSHGHLVLVERWLGLPREGALAREVALHLGTLVAVTLFCWQDLRLLLRPGSAGIWRMLVLATLITGATGLLAEDWIERELTSPAWIAAGLVANAVLLVLVAPRDDGRLVRSLGEAGWRDGLVLGLLQSFALAPSVSRSASTIVAALLLGFRRRDAVHAAFLVSLPAVAGAILLKALDAGEGAGLAEPGMLAGLLSSLVVGLLALLFLARHVDVRSLRAFGVYCLLLAAVVIFTA